MKKANQGNFTLQKKWKKIKKLINNKIKKIKITQNE